MALFKKEFGHSSCGGCGAFYTRASCPNTRGIAKLYHLAFNIQYQVLISKSNLVFFADREFLFLHPLFG